MSKFIFIFFVLGISQSVSAVNLPPEFKCNQTNFAKICSVKSVNTKTFKYPLPVTVIIPLDKVNAEATDYVLYIHGFRGVCTTSSGTPDSQISPFDFVKTFGIDKGLAQAVAAVPVPALMVVPMSSGKNAEHNSYLVPKLTSFINWFESVMGSKNIRWHMAGHSGAGSVIARSLDQNKVAAIKMVGVSLLDATYSMSSHIDEWEGLAHENRQIGIYSIYIKSSSTAAGSLLLQKTLNQLKTNGKPTLMHPVLVEGVNAPHCQFPNLFLQKTLQKSLGL